MKMTSDDLSFKIKFSAAIDNERGFGSTDTILLTDADWAINNVEYPTLQPISKTTFASELKQ